jgi:hypothetical protein
MDELIEEFGETVTTTLLGMVLIYVFTMILEMVL